MVDYIATHPYENGVRQYDATAYIKACMRVREMSYKQLGDAVGTSAQNIWNILNGSSSKKAGPKLGTMKQLLRALDAQLDLESCEARPELLVESAELDEIPFDALAVLLEALGQRLVIKARRETKDE